MSASWALERSSFFHPGGRAALIFFTSPCWACARESNPRASPIRVSAAIIFFMLRTSEREKGGWLLGQLGKIVRVVERHFKENPLCKSAAAAHGRIITLLPGGVVQVGVGQPRSSRRHRLKRRQCLNCRNVGSRCHQKRPFLLL